MTCIYPSSYGRKNVQIVYMKKKKKFDGFLASLPIYDLNIQPNST